MSKIQKALEALRDTKDGRAENAGALDTGPLAKKVQHEARKRAGGPNGASPELSAVEQPPEIQPKQSIEIDLEELSATGLHPRTREKDIVSDQFRRIKRPILQCAFETDLPTGENANVIMVASALPGAGKSFCSVNLAQSIATERDVGAVLVDADVLKPSISRSLGLQEHVGLIDYLIDPSIEIADILVDTDLHDIIVIPSGHKHPEATELLASRRMRELIAQLSAKFQSRAVIFDTPPLLITNEAQVLAERMGQIVLVIEARVSSQESVMRALGMLDREKPINAILNKSRSAAEKGYRSDDYGYYPYGSNDA